MTNVLVLGSTGMLAAMMVDVLRRDPSLTLRATTRSLSEATARGFGSTIPLEEVDAERGDIPDLDGVDWVVNCTGLIKPYIHDDRRGDVERALVINCLFPTRLAEAAERTGTRVLQIATDCVYSGRDGNYVESALHDATDVYGKTKSMGEIRSPVVAHLRCSVIGPQHRRDDSHSLLAWFLRQPVNVRLNGFTNHQWNGLTTLHFARICGGIIASRMDLPHCQHIVPSGDISKADLLRAFARGFDREDISIADVNAATDVDRRIGTTNSDLSDRLWNAAGYPVPPTVEQMVHELRQHRFVD